MPLCYTDRANLIARRFSRVCLHQPGGHTMGLIQALLQLQALDQDWDTKGAVFQQLRARLADQSDLESRRAAHEALEQNVTAQHARLRNLELELESLQQKAQQVEADLYGGRVRSPRELESLGQDSQLLKKRMAETEETVLVLMSALEQQEAQRQTSAVEWTRFERAWKLDRQTQKTQYQALRETLQALRDEHEKVRAALDASALSLYDHLRKIKGGAALAPMSEGICLTCRVTVPTAKAKLVRTGGQAITCEGCGRILYIA
jgi:uncharacterized protein